MRHAQSPTISTKIDWDTFGMSLHGLEPLWEGNG